MYFFTCKNAFAYFRNDLAFVEHRYAKASYPNIIFASDNGVSIRFFVEFENQSVDRFQTGAVVASVVPIFIKMPVVDKLGLFKYFLANTAFLAFGMSERGAGRF